MPIQHGEIFYTGVGAPKGGVYTQTLGVFPDTVSLRCVPQVTSIPSTGTVTFSYNGSSVTLPNCFLKSPRVVQDADQGHLLSLTLLDRRWRWHRVAPISGYFNVRVNGSYVTAKKRNLQQLATILFTAMGEGSANVSVLSTSIYPEVQWDCEAPALMLDQLLRTYGCSVSLGFGAEAPTVVVMGTGSVPGTAGAMMVSSSLDASIRPQYTRVCFAPSIMQARFKLEPIALETNDTWVDPDTVSYVTAGGWATEDPYRLPTVEVNETSETYNRAVKSVYRAYRIVSFASGTLSLPDGSGTLASITQCLPLRDRILTSETLMPDGTGIPYKIFGKRFVHASENGQPAKDTTFTIDDEIIGERVLFDRENGVLVFEKPQFFKSGAVGAEEYNFAELYLECSFSLLDTTNNYPAHYEKDTTLDASGYGYHSVRYYDIEKRIIVTYGAGQSASSSSDNQADLDAIAAGISSAVASQYPTTASRMIVYNQPVLSLRCNGLVHQVQHIISDGTRHAGSISVAAINLQFDRGVPSQNQRSQMLHFLKKISNGSSL